MRKAIALVLSAAACVAGPGPTPVPAASAPEMRSITAPRDASVPVAVHLPDGPGPFPAIVIAPGSGYHMRLPLTEGLAEAAATAGYAAFRFDWAYCAYDPATGECTGRAGRDRAPEEEDLRAVLDFARRHPRVDARRIVLAGKSRGSVVAWDVFRADTALTGLILLTPVCTGESDATKAPVPTGPRLYAGLAAERRPVLVLLGDADENCRLPMLFDWLAGTRGNVAVATFGGNHGLGIPAEGEAGGPRSDRNKKTAVSTAVHWANLMLGR